MDKTLSVTVSIQKKHASSQYPEKENNATGTRDHKVSQTLSDPAELDQIQSFFKSRNGNLQDSYDIQSSLPNINSLYDEELPEFCKARDCAVFQVCITELKIDDQGLMKLDSTDSGSLIITTDFMGVVFNSLPIQISASPKFDAKQNYLIVDYRKFFNLVTNDVFSVKLLELNDSKLKPIAEGKLKFEEIAKFPRTQLFSFIELWPTNQNSEKQEEHFGMLMYWYRLIGDIETIAVYSHSDVSFSHDLENNSNYKATLEDKKINMTDILKFKTAASNFLNAAAEKKEKDESLANAKPRRSIESKSNKIKMKSLSTHAKSKNETDRVVERNLSPLIENSLVDSLSIQQPSTTIQQQSSPIQEQSTPIQQWSLLLPEIPSQLKEIENIPTQNAETQVVTMGNISCQTSFTSTPSLPSYGGTSLSSQFATDEPKSHLRYDKSYESEKSPKSVSNFHKRTAKTSSVSFSLSPDKKIPNHNYPLTRNMSPHFNPKTQCVRSITDSEAGNQLVKSIESLVNITNLEDSATGKRNTLFWNPKNFKANPSLSIIESSVVDISRYKFNFDSNESVKNDLSKTQDNINSNNRLSNVESVSSISQPSTDLSLITNPTEKLQVEPTSSNVTSFSNTLGLVLARNNALEVTQSEISDQLDNRADWLHEESDWRRTLQEYAILQGEDPAKVPWRQWRDKKTETLKPRKYSMNEEVVHPELNITVHSLEFKKEALKNSKIKQVYIEYVFLTHHGEEMETPFSLPLPNYHDLKPIVFEFTKIFFFDPKRNKRDRTLLAELVKTKQNIRFNVVSEPLDDEMDTKDCEEVGYVNVNMFDLAQCENDIIREDFPIKETNNEEKIIGNLNISIINVKAIRKVALDILSPPDFKFR